MKLRKASEVVGNINSQGPISHPATADTEPLSGRLRALANYAADGPPSLMVTDMIALMREAADRLGKPESPADPNDGGFGEAAYCHHRHHLDEHSTNFDTCPHRICVAARHGWVNG